MVSEVLIRFISWICFPLLNLSPADIWISEVRGFVMILWICFEPLEMPSEDCADENGALDAWKAELKTLGEVENNFIAGGYRTRGDTVWVELENFFGGNSVEEAPLFLNFCVLLENMRKLCCLEESRWLFLALASLFKALTKLARERSVDWTVASSLLRSLLILPDAFFAWRRTLSVAASKIFSPSYSQGLLYSSKKVVPRWH